MPIRLRSIALATGMTLATALAVFAQADREAPGPGVSEPAPPVVSGDASPIPASDPALAGKVGDAYLAELAGVDLQSLNLQAQDVVDIDSILNDDQAPILLQALAANEDATRNAGAVAERLRTQGLIAADEDVIGLRDGKVVKAKKSRIQEILDHGPDDRM